MSDRVSSPAAPAADLAGINRIHRFFERQAVLAPDAVALLHHGQSVTYAECDARAERLARHLQSRGVGPEVIVGICLERSVGAIISVLAVLKAGGAYLPLDPAYPGERLAYMIGNSRAALLITEPEIWQCRAAPGPTISFRAFEADLPADLPPALSPDPAPAADPLAYVIYTSGSTGRPKGVAVAHVSASHLVRWHMANMPVPPGARVLQLAPLSFDVSIQEIFATLADGGTLVLLDETLRRDPRGLRRFLAEQRVNRVFCTPVLLYQIAEQSGPPLPDLRDLTAAGEQLRITPAVRHFFAHDTAATLRNQYGPTETTVITHSHVLTGPPESWPLLPPLGPTIEGVTTRLLDPAGQPVPAGQPGELYFGGRVVSRGYLHDPERTAAAFLPDPDPAAPPGARLYRSGDLSQQNPDGTWQFLGRADDQVKIRGFRVELGEIEAVLAKHPAIEQAAVAASDPTPAGDRELLAGYLLRASAAAPASGELREWLRDQLPDYYVPARLVPLDRLPQTPSGKLDRRALAAACLRERADEKPIPPAAQPRTPAEQTIAQVWCNVLGRSAVGLDDNFFEAGGNSISAARAHASLCETLKTEFPIVLLFQHPTIRALAARLSVPENAAAAAGPSLSAAQERARRQQQAFAARPVPARR